MIGYLYALISTFAFSLNQVYNKKLSENLKPLSAVLLRNLFLIICLFVVTVFFGNFNHNFNLKIFSIIIFTGICSYVAILYLFKSFKYLSIAESISIANLFPFVFAILSILFLKNSINLIEFIIMIIIFFGIVLIVNKKLTFTFKKQLIYPAITMVGWGIYMFGVNYLLIEKNSVLNILVSLELVVLASNLIYIKFKKIKI